MEGIFQLSLETRKCSFEFSTELAHICTTVIAIVERDTDVAIKQAVSPSATAA